MRRTRPFVTGEHGAIFIQVGLAIFVLMAFNVFVLDYGMLWIARSQAQNAADAGALAGALARGYDERVDPPHPAGLAASIAARVAAANLVWNQAPGVAVSFNCPAGVTGDCTRVDVHRDGNAGSNELNVLFGPILGVSDQRVRATATALTANGNAVACMSPLALADDWVENYDNAAEPGREFSRYIEYGGTAGQLITPNHDDYTPPGGAFAGLVTVSANFGESIVWEIGHAIVDPIRRERIAAIDLPGGRTFAQNMTNCSGTVIGPGERFPLITTLHPQEIADQLTAAYQRDPGADYDYGNNRITGSCAPACAPISPRLLAVALFDPAKFQLGRATGNWTQPDVGCPTNVPCLTVTNIVGFFVHRAAPASGVGPHGHVLRYPGVTNAGAPSFVDDGSWLVTTHLIR